MFIVVLLILVAISLAMRMAMNLAYGARGPDSGDDVPWIVSVLSWVLLSVAILGLVVAPLMFSVLGLVFLIIGGFAVVDAVRASRESSRRMNAKLLAIAFREGRGGDALDLLSQLRHGFFVVGPATAQLANDLKSGAPLYDATISNRPALPTAAAAYTAIGALAAREADALDELSEPEASEIVGAWRKWYDSAAYAIGVLLTTSVIFSYFAFFILPSFEEIFSDFGLELPLLTQMLVLSESTILLVGFVASAAVLTLIALACIGGFYLFDIDVLRWVIDRLRGHTRFGNALRLVAFAIEHKVDLPRTLEAIQFNYHSQIAKARLAKCTEALRSGVPWTAAFQQCRMISRHERALLDTAEQVGNVPWALRQIVHRRELIASMRMNLFGNLFFPLVIFALSSIVGFVVIALFVPLVKLILELC
jgi:type II secretory pathway component PulF